MRLTNGREAKPGAERGSPTGISEQGTAQNQRQARLEAVLDLVLALDHVQSESQSIEEMLAVLHKGIARLMDASNFYVALCDERRENFRLAYFRDRVDVTNYDEIGWMPLRSDSSSLTCRVILGNKPLLVTDADHITWEAQLKARVGIGPRATHWMGMPLLQNGQAVGAMVMQSYEPGWRYSQEDIALFQMLANSVAASILRGHAMTWLAQAVTERTRELEAEVAVRRRSEELQRGLYEISALSGEDDLSDDGYSGYQKLHAIIGRLLPAKNFFVAFHEPAERPEDDQISMAYFVDEKDSDWDHRGERFPMGNGLTSLVIRSGKPWRLDKNTLEELVRTGVVKQVYGNTNINSWIGSPLILQGRTQGAIVLQSYDDSLLYSEGDLELLNYVARHIAGSLSKLRARIALNAAQQDLVQRNKALAEALSNLRTTQEELVRTERLASLGGLVAGVAHEINTPLGVCVTAVSHLESELDLLVEDFEAGRLSPESVSFFIEAAKEAMNIVNTNMQRAAKLVASFKQISVDQTSEASRTVALHGYFQEVLVSLGPSLKNKPVEVKLDCPATLSLKTLPGALAQVVTNLIMNSVQHGFDGRPAELGKGQVMISAEPRGDVVLIRYTDDGVGMDAASLEKLFDPFYTTKRGRGGSGLGAHIVFNLVTGPMGGRIKAISESGQGLRYEISLPLASEIESESSPEDSGAGDVKPA